MKKKLLLLIIAGMAILLPSCSSTEDTPPQNSLNMINPYVNHVTMKEAERNVGFTLKLPEAPFKLKDTVYRENILDPMLEVIMYGENGEELRIRKAPGNEDISGNWNDYRSSTEITMGRDLVRLQGEEGRIYLATWTSGGYSYSAFMSEGLEGNAFLELVKDIR